VKRATTTTKTKMGLKGQKKQGSSDEELEEGNIDRKQGSRGKKNRKKNQVRTIPPLFHYVLTVFVPPPPGKSWSSAPTKTLWQTRQAYLSNNLSKPAPPPLFIMI
jgi:hypothetical protein